MRFSCIAAALLLATHAGASSWGSWEAYSTITALSTTVQSSVNFTWISDDPICSRDCSFLLEGTHLIHWSRTGEVMNTRTFMTTASYYRAMTEAEGMAGECFFATGQATYTWEAGSGSSIESPSPPYVMGQTSVQSPTTCIGATTGHRNSVSSVRWCWI